MALLLSDEVPRPLLLLQSRQFPIPNVETYDRTFERKARMYVRCAPMYVRRYMLGISMRAWCAPILLS